MQEQHAQQHVEQRIDEVAQAGVHHPTVRYRPDVEKPVAAQQQRTGNEAGQQARIGPDSSQPAPVTAPGEHQPQEHQRPHHAVQQDLHWRDAVEGFDIERQQAPDDVGEQRVDDAGLHEESQGIGGFYRRKKARAGHGLMAGLRHLAGGGNALTACARS